MKTKSLFFDPNSRYNNIDETKVVFLTPNHLIDLDIGFPIEENFKPDEYDSQFPLLLDTLKEMVKETTIGDINGSEIQFPIENSQCVAFICISVNGKLCKLQREEWDMTNNFHGIPIHSQVKVFQRLISEGQITLQDLAAADIDNEVYKKLVVNDLTGVQSCRSKIENLEKIWKEQSKNPDFQRKLQKLNK